MELISFPDHQLWLIGVEEEPDCSFALSFVESWVFVHLKSGV